VPGTTGTKLTYFAAGAAIAVLGATAVSLVVSSSDEERPPIIVRGGSLIFESGDKNKPKEPKGKKWVTVPQTTYWQPDHANGISVTDLTIAIRGGSQTSCPALDRVPGDVSNDESTSTPPVITVTYTVGQAQPTTVTVTTKKKGNKWIPTIDASGGRQENDNTDYPQLVFGNHGEGAISRVQFRGQNGNVDCQGPITSLKIWQDK